MFIVGNVEDDVEHTKSILQSLITLHIFLYIIVFLLISVQVSYQDMLRDLKSFRNILHWLRKLDVVPKYFTPFKRAPRCPWMCQLLSPV